MTVPDVTGIPACTFNMLLLVIDRAFIIPGLGGSTTISRERERERGTEEGGREEKRQKIKPVSQLSCSQPHTSQTSYGHSDHTITRYLHRRKNDSADISQS